MEIAWAEFTPVASFAGGAMIGLAALFLMLLNGRVMGMSGILSGLLVKRPDWAWRLAFVIGVIVGPFLFMGLTGAPVERQRLCQARFSTLRPFWLVWELQSGQAVPRVMVFVVCHGFHCARWRR